MPPALATLTCLLITLGVGIAKAASIPGLFPTGVSDARQPLPGGSPDPHWRLVESADPSFPGPAAFVVADGYPIPPWLANSTTSKWIAPRANQNSGNLPGRYRYRLLFDLAGLDPATAMITGRWSSDNEGIEARLNDQPLALQTEGNFGTFSAPWTIRSGFLPGTNSLEFVVNNAGTSVNPTGFRAEISGTAEPTPATNSPPSILADPMDQAVAFKETARLRVEATGSPPLGFQWRFGANALPGRTEATLDLPYASPINAGLYDVVVSNAHGAVTSRVARLSLTPQVHRSERRESPGPSSRRTGIIFSEIHHAPAPDPDGRDLRFVELHNTNPFPEDLSGWSLAGDAAFTFPQGTVIPGLGSLVIAPNPTDIRSAYGAIPVIGGFPSRLGPGRAHLLLRKRSGAIQLETDFTSEATWEVASLGGGPSRVLARPSFGEADPNAWSASTYVGGSPGAPDPDPPAELSGLRLNELLAEATATTSPFVELHNQSPLPADLSGATLASLHPQDGEVVVPPGTVLPPAGFLALSGEAVTRLLHPEGGTLLLRSPDQRRVLDAVRYPGQIPHSSWGRVPEGAARWTTTTHPTPEAPNARFRLPELTFSEIHFEPLNGAAGEEFVELHNRSNHTLDLTGWQLAGGIAFPFPPGTQIPSGGMLAIARNATRLRALHPELPSSRIVGDFAGSLRNRGESLSLLRPITESPAGTGEPAPPPARFRYLALEDDVQYQARARGNRWAAGGGSSLERVHFEGPTHDPAAWRDSVESDKAAWTTVESTGPLTLVHPGVPAADQLQILLLGPGEALIDDVEVLVSGANRVTNGRFESGTSGWFFQGTHRTSRVDPAAGPDGSRALHLVATDRGDHVANRVRTVLTSPIPATTVATLRAKVRWLAGHPEILLRLRNGGLEAAAPLNTPPDSGTPGTTNSRSVTPAPPTVSYVHHQPVLPATGVPTRVFAHLTSATNLASVNLVYRRDPASTLSTTPMTDDGTGPDEFAGDGVFTGSIPGQTTGSLIAYRIVAQDQRGALATHPDRTGPGALATEALIRWGETTLPGAFGSYRIWMTSATRDTWSRREKMSNEDLPVTFVSGADRVIQGAGAHYSGSSYTSPGYDSPTGALCGYDLSFPDDDRFLGADRATLDWPIRDDTNQREQLMFWFLEQYGLPNLHRRYVRLTVNGIRRGTIYDDVQQPDGDTIEQWYPDDDEGTLWKTDCWNEFDNAGTRIDPCILNTLQRFPASGPKKVARYRWNWRPRAVTFSANDFTDLFALIDATTATANYVPTVEALVDVDHWMRTFAMNDLASYWDAFGNPNAKNTFLYKPRHGGWQLFCWDFDVGLGVFNDPPNAGLFDVNDPTLARMYRTPAFVRRYWAALQEALDSWFRTGTGSPIDQLLDAKYAAFQTNAVPLASPTAIKSWIRQRRSFLLQQLAGVRTSFAITSNGGSDLSSQDPTITLTGTAPVAVATLKIQGRERTVTWNSVSNWSVRLSLQPGVNEFGIEGIDRLGNPIPGANDVIRVTFTGTPSPVPPLRFNEWLAQNNTSLTNPFTGEPDDWFELHNPTGSPVDLSGFSLTDNPADPTRFLIPSGFQIPAMGYLLVWADGHPEATGLGSGLHTGFRLSADGETLVLFDPLGRLVDTVSFGPQLPDRSEGRWPDGTPPPFLRFQTPTPGGPNTTPPDPPADFRLSVTFPAGTDALRLSWRAIPGRTYQAESTEDWTAPTWTAVAPPQTAEAAEASVIDPRPIGPQRYYRVRLLP